MTREEGRRIYEQSTWGRLIAARDAEEMMMVLASAGTSLTEFEAAARRHTVAHLSPARRVQHIANDAKLRRAALTRPVLCERDRQDFADAFAATIRAEVAKVFLGDELRQLKAAGADCGDLLAEVEAL